MTRFFVAVLGVLAGLMVSGPVGAQVASEKIVKIRVEGAKRVDEASILRKVQSREGEPVSDAILKEDLKRVASMEGIRFADVLKNPVEGGVEVVFKVEEWPALKRVKVTGAKKIKQAKVEEVLALRDMHFFRDEVLREDVTRVEDLYRSKGFTGVKVDTQVDKLEGGAAVEVTFKVDEAVRIMVKEIRFEGLKALDARELEKAMETRTYRFFRRRFLDRDALEKDIEKIIEKCKDSGYLKARVLDHGVKMDEKKGEARIWMKVDEGQLYRTSDIALTGKIEVMKRDELQKLMKLKVGEPYSPGLLAADRQAIVEAYYGHGYVLARVSSDTRVDDKAHDVRIEHSIHEGGPVRVESVDIVGNTKTLDKVIRRELRLEPGDLLDARRLRRSRENLWKLRYFEDVKFDIQDGSAPDLKKIVFRVEEGKTGNVLLGGGYNSVDGLFGRVEVDMINFDISNPKTFSGGGQDIHLAFEGGSVRRNFDLSFTDPWFRDEPRSIGFDLYGRQRFWDFYDEEREGAAGRYGWHLGEFTRAVFSYRYELADISDMSPEASEILQQEAGSYNTSRVQLSLTRDDIILDRMFYPHEGSRSSLSAELAPEFLGSDREFTRYTGESSWYLPVHEPWVLNFRLKGGVVQSFGDTDEVPILERFFAGGPDTIRGYRYRKVGPRDENNEPIGGGYMLIGNVEGTYPIGDYVRGALFVDSGNVWEDQEDIKLSEVRSAVGFGVRVKIPRSPLSFQVDWGWALDREPDDRSGELSFTMRSF